MLQHDDGMTVIYKGDCLNEMDNINKVNLIVTSPPYNMTPRKGGYADSGRYDGYVDWMSEEDYLQWIAKCFNKFDKILTDDGVIAFNFSYSIENPSLPYKVVCEIVNSTNFSMVDTVVWKKKCGIPFPANKHRLSRLWEYVFIFSKKGYENRFSINRKVKSTSLKTGQSYYEVVYNFIEAKNNDGKTPFNQATFSSELVGKILDVYAFDHSESFCVLDPFMGTGTTGAECRRRKIKFIGIEISQKQCEYAINRIKSISENEVKE